MYFYAFLLLFLNFPLEVLGKDEPLSIEQVSAQISAFMKGGQGRTLSTSVTSSSVLSGCALAVSNDLKQISHFWIFLILISALFSTLSSQEKFPTRIAQHMRMKSPFTGRRSKQAPRPFVASRQLALQTSLSQS